MTPNPDPLHVPEPEPPRRSGCLSVLPWLALLLAIALGIVVPAPSEALKLSPTVTVLRGAPLVPGGNQSARGEVRESAVGWYHYPDPVPGGAPTPTGSVGSALIGGWISWADPDLGGDYLATRFPRGTLVRLCTPNRCIVRRSNDFGPSAKIDPPRIADLAVLDWEQLCGLPRARGVCRGTVEAIGDLPLPPTDMEEP